MAFIKYYGPALFLVAMFSVLNGFAEPDDSNNQISDKEYEVLKSAIAPYVYSLTKPVYVYNWHNRGTDSNFKDPKDIQEYAGFQKMTAKYWDKQKDRSSSYYGEGMYAAVDPVKTRIYGATFKGSRFKEFEDFWVLTEIKLPAGFRMFDAGRDEVRKPLASPPAGFFKKIGCPANWDIGFQLLSILRPNEYSGHPKCAEIIRRLLEQDLKVDGLAYGYGVTQFSQCDTLNPAKVDQVGNKESAFVIINGRKLGSNEVNIFNKNSVGQDEARLRIQSMFMLQYLLEHPKIRDKSTISLSALEGRSRLWSDLDGKKIPDDMKEWMRENLYHCEMSIGYKNAFKSTQNTTDTKLVSVDDNNDKETSIPAK